MPNPARKGKRYERLVCRLLEEAGLPGFKRCLEQTRTSSGIDLESDRVPWLVVQTSHSAESVWQKLREMNRSVPPGKVGMVVVRRSRKGDIVCFSMKTLIDYLGPLIAAHPPDAKP